MITGREEKISNSDYHMKIYTWGGKVGHASLEINAEKGNDYLSYWPLGRSMGDTVPRPVRLQTYSQDCKAEQRETDYAPREAEGVYQIALTKEQANDIFASIQDIRKKVNKNELKYTLFNQANSEEGKQNENYNCSGMVQDVLAKTVKLDCGDPVLSHPLVLAGQVLEMPNVKVLKHSTKDLGFELPEGLVESVQPTDIQILRPSML